MWLVEIVAKLAPGYGIWHYLKSENEERLACGLRNPPWYFRFDGKEWEEAGNIPVVAVLKWCDDTELDRLRRLDPEFRCKMCWRALDEEIARIRHAALVEAKLAEGKSEVTPDSIVSLRDLANGDGFNVCFSPELEDDRTLFRSPMSPLGTTLLGQFEGDGIVADTPEGSVEYEIVAAAQHQSA